MTLKFTFFYKNSNKDYFLALLQKVANTHSVEIYTEISDEYLNVFASGENLSDFATDLEHEIPLSLYFRLKDVELCKKPTNTKPITSNLQDIFSVSEINAIKNPQSSHFCDIFKHTNMEFLYTPCDTKGSKAYKIDSSDLLKNALKNLCDSLKQGQNITLTTNKGMIALFTKISNQNSDFDFILANDISTINLLTRASSDEINALASFEKPLINLVIKEVFINEIGANSALFILPYDIILCCISSILLELQIGFVYAKKINSTNLNLHYNSSFKSNFFEVVVGQNGYFLQKNFLDSNPKNNLWNFLDFSFADFKDKSNGSKNSQDLNDSTKNSDIFIAYLSTLNPTILANLSNKMPLLTIAFDKNPKNILQKIATLENGNKLITNFAKEFNLRYQAIQSLDSTTQLSNNIIDIFECAAMILGCDKVDKNAIFDLAQNYLRDIGPKIDFKNINIDNLPYYDESRTIRSIMSFALAGSESEVIAFGILESLADYLILIFRDAQDKFYTKNMGIIGDIFANKIFFDKITKKIPTDLNLIFPKYLDFNI